MLTSVSLVAAIARKAPSRSPSTKVRSSQVIEPSAAYSASSGDDLGRDDVDVALAEQQALDLLERDVAAADHQAAAALELQARHVEGRLEHVAHAGLVADPALELADALLALEGRCWHGPEVRGGQASAASVCSRPVGDRALRAPAEALGGELRVEHRALDLARARAGASSGSKSSRPESAADLLGELEHGRLDAGAGVERPALLASSMASRPSTTSRHVDVVAGLLAGRRRRWAGRRPAPGAEDRHHAGLGGRVLPRPVDVAQAKRARRRARACGRRGRGSPRRPACSGRRRRTARTGAVSAKGSSSGRSAPSPYMAPPVEVKTSREASARAAASSTFTVPTTFRRASNPGSAIERRTSIWAARWKTLSGSKPSIAAKTPAASATSSSVSVAPASSAPARFSRLPLERSSSTRTSSPRAARASTRVRADEPRAACHHGFHAGEPTGATYWAAEIPLLLSPTAGADLKTHRPPYM